MTEALRWGIAGAGNISNDFATAVSVLPQKRHRLVAIGTRSLSSAQQFASKFSIPAAYGSYDDLINAKDIDIIYIGTVNSSHKDLVMKALDAGKHVLCEKALGVNAHEVKMMVEKAREKKLFLMEAFWSRFFPVYDEVRKELSSKELIGDAKIVTVQFVANLPNSSSRRVAETCGGALLDLGCYAVMVASMVFGGETPTRIAAAGVINDDGVDESVSVGLTYSNGRMANLFFSLASTLDKPRIAQIIGTKGYVRIEHPFYCPIELTKSDGTVFHSPMPGKLAEDKYCFDRSEGLGCYEAEHVYDCIRKGLTESPIMPLSESITIAQIEDEIRQQIGLKYRQDEDCCASA